MLQALVWSLVMLQALVELWLEFLQLLYQPRAHARESACLRFQTRLQQLRKELQLRQEFQLESPSVRGAGFASAEPRCALGRSHLVAGSIAAMRLRSHTQEALSQEFPRNSSDNLGFLHPKEHEASLAWSYQLFSRIQIGPLPNQFGRVPHISLSLDIWAWNAVFESTYSIICNGSICEEAGRLKNARR
jgi:hypothetical protein